MFHKTAFPAGSSCVAIVTRTKDRPLMLERAAASVAAQRFQDFIWVVINDGGDEAVVRTVLGRFPALAGKIHFLSNPVSRGMEAASNAAIAACSTEFIVIHDDDDTWEPRFLEETVEFLQGREGARYGGVICQTQYVSEEIVGERIVERGRWLYRAGLDSIDLAAMIRGNLFPPISFLFRREVYDRLGGFDERLPVLGDWSFNLDFLMQADIGVLPRMLANYHHRDQGSGKTGIYANSVIGASSLHARYVGVVRSGFVRKNAARSAAPLVATLGGIVEEQQALLARYEVLNWRSQHSSLVSGGGIRLQQDTLDLCWVLAQANDYLRRNWLCTLLRRGLLLFPIGLDAEWDGVLKRVRQLKMLVPDPPGFDAKAYLEEHKDVALAVERGEQRTAYMHYIFCGRSEGRSRPIQ